MLYVYHIYVVMNSFIFLQLKKIVRDSEVMREDDHSWPPPDKVGRQELEVVLDGEVCSCICVNVLFKKMYIDVYIYVYIYIYIYIYITICMASSG